MGEWLIKLIEENPGLLALAAVGIIVTIFVMVGKMKANASKTVYRPPSAYRPPSRREMELHAWKEQKKREQAIEAQQASAEVQRQKHEAVYLPRFVEALNLLPKIGDFKLVQRCVQAGAHIIKPESMQALFNEHRDSILKTAVKLNLQGQNQALVEQSLGQLLSCMQLHSELSPLLLDLEREIRTSQLPAVAASEVDPFQESIQSLTTAKSKRISTIEKSEISDADKKRLIEEIEFEFSERLSQLIADDSTSKTQRQNP